MKKTIVTVLAAIAAVSAATAATAQPRGQQAYTLDWKIEEHGANGWEVLSSGFKTAAAPRNGQWSDDIGFSVSAQKPYLAAVEQRVLENGKVWKTPVEAMAEYGTKLDIRFKDGKGELPVKVEFNDSKLAGEHDGFDRFTAGGSTIMLRNLEQATLKGEDTVKPGEWAYPLAKLPSNYRVAIKLTPVT